MDELRKIDLAFLNRYYESGRSNILVVYGHRNVEQTSLLLKFIENRRHMFYTARKVSEREQIRIWQNELMEDGAVFSDKPTFTELFNVSVGSASGGPYIFVIKDFEYIVKTSSDFVKDLVDFVEKTGKYRQILVILASRDVS